MFNVESPPTNHRAHLRYTTLDQSGQVDRLSALHDLAEVQYISEEEMKLAIEELARSTDAITKQADTLRQQQDALSRLITKTSQNDSRRKNFEAVRERQSEVERKHTAAEVRQRFAFEADVPKANAYT